MDQNITPVVASNASHPVRCRKWDMFLSFSLGREESALLLCVFVRVRERANESPVPPWKLLKLGDFPFVIYSLIH